MTIIKRKHPRKTLRRIEWIRSGDYQIIIGHRIRNRVTGLIVLERVGKAEEYA